MWMKMGSKLTSTEILEVSESDFLGLRMILDLTEMFTRSLIGFLFSFSIIFLITMFLESLSLIKLFEGSQYREYSVISTFR
jgi:hypothetical protein